MASSFHLWESDPLFSAAEIVQESADRMGSIFRLLWHERSLVHGDHPDTKLLASIECHTRDLATALETANWQLEDFEREVILSAMKEKSETKQNVVSRHKEFIRAIRDHIVSVQRSLEGICVGKVGRNTEWVNLNEQDRDGLALFLSGEKPVENVAHYNSEDQNMVRRFPDPNASSSVKDEIVEQSTRQSMSSNMNVVVHLDHSSDLKENKLRNLGSHYSVQIGSEAPSFIQVAAFDGYNEDECCDLEANETKVESSFLNNKLRLHHSKINVFASLGNILYACGRRTSRNFTKRWKDGEEQGHSSPYIDLFHGAQGQYQK
ncbi:hypothetical protein RJ639_044929 [Escallonia herrerae]|uniref:Syntaxin 6/10/61 N-terminal domain-containing protein n=1 Tax=Escallonia herrerae TaxID=1293975 RepID=A0AA88WDF2_9ASTE|nr:hypothetical protein RJ639_044929 [Escallonia herrerae]